MKCPRCERENPADAVFCQECGSQLEAVCSTCGTGNQLGAKFCKKCGQSLAPAGVPGTVAAPKFASPNSYTPKHLAEKILTSKSALEGERKQVTVLFADLKGSMELLADRDPEEARKLLDPVLERMMEAVHRYEGTVNQVMGDGIMALFGAPLAHEDHAVRACYAALRMQEAVKRYAEEVHRTVGVPVHIRVGLNSGEVVVRSIGSDLRMDYTAVGQTTHLAARMEQAASPGTVRLTAETLRLAEGYVEVGPLGPIPVKGLTGPVEVHELTGAGPVRRRFEAAAVRGLTRFVGREAELDQLKKALGLAEKGHGRIVAVVGEPGVGKSRLFHEFTHSHRTQGWLIRQSGSASYGSATPYLPVIELLKGYFQIESRDDARKILEKVTGKLLALDRSLEPALSALLSLLDVPVDDPQWNALDPPQRRRRTLEAIKRLLLGESLVQPLILEFEDLQWIDSETQAVLDTLVEALPTARMLFLLNYRPEYQHGWSGKSYYRQLQLDALPPESAQEVLDALLGSDPGLAHLKELLIERTEGNPFFLEESVRTLVETKALAGERGAYSLTRPVNAIRVPATVQTILAARIDRLPSEEKHLLQSAAVIGHEVPFVLLEAIAELPEEELRRGLARLQAAEFLYEMSLFPDLEYVFKHALTQEVAYQSLLKGIRERYHERIARVLEGRFPEIGQSQPELLAHHYTEAGLSEQAVGYWLRAGQRANERSAHAEGIRHLRRGLELLMRLPETAERSRRELDFQIALGPALMATKGYAVAEVESPYARALELCRQVEETPQLFPVLRGLWYFHSMRGDLRTAREVGQQLFALTNRLQDPALLPEAHWALAVTLFYLGEVSQSRVHLEQGHALYDPQLQHVLTLRHGVDAGVRCLSSLAWALWILGYPDQALERAHQAHMLARKLSHPFSLAVALNYIARLHQFRREAQATRQWADALIALCAEQGFAHYLAQGTILRGWALAIEGGGKDGIVQIRQGLAAYEAAGSELGRPRNLALLAEVYGNAGQADEGLRVLEVALTYVRKTEDRYYASELHRLRGELLLALSPADQAAAEACFHEAVDIARHQQAKSLELRVATKLGRLWQHGGRRDEAQQLLAEVYRHFTEGFDTPDLLEAKALLDELS